MSQYTQGEIIEILELATTTDALKIGTVELVLDGIGCLACGQIGGEMRPVGDGPRGQVFAHTDCLED